MDFSNLEIDLNQPELRFALDLIQAGVPIARRIQAETSVRSLTKTDRSPVTLADMGIQAVAGALLEKDFPKQILVAEESSEPLREPGGAEDLAKIAEYIRPFFPKTTPEKICEWIDRGQGAPGDSFWTLDPIDGTKGFLRGGQYAIALALIRNGKIEMAALGCPNLKTPEALGARPGLLVLAVRGKGCWGATCEDDKHWVRLQVSPCKKITQARILDSMDPEHKNSEKNEKIRKTLGILSPPIPLDSQAKHVVLASGGAEIFFRTLSKRDSGYREKIWDVAPGAFVLEEAGGRVTDLDGKPIDYGAGQTLDRNAGFLATNGFLHDAVLDALRRVTV